MDKDQTKPIYVTRPSMPPYEEFCREIASLWDTRFLTNFGEKHNRLEQALAGYLGVENFVLTVNGHLALETAVEAMELAGEVITSPFTFASSTHALVRHGLTPVFCDVRKDTFTMDADLIEPLITEKTTAILPVHVYGVPCEVTRIDEIANKHHLKVLYDAAHAFGVRVGGVPIATYGDISMFSFHATKVFHTIEGGGLAVNHAACLQRLNLVKRFGIPAGEDALLAGTNAKMNEFQAAMGLCNLPLADQSIAERKRVCERYDAHFTNVSGIQLLPDMPEVTRNYSYYPIIFHDAFGKTRDEVCAALEAEQIYPRKYFCPPTNRLTCYRDKGYRGETPISDELSERVLCLPLYAELTNGDADRIARLILNKSK
ncbi:MAG: DegT/DnrJ/EryC1/StrS family aminotransferase [Clostridia bacterium]